MCLDHLFFAPSVSTTILFAVAFPALSFITILFPDVDAIVDNVIATLPVAVYKIFKNSSSCFVVYVAPLTDVI